MKRAVELNWKKKLLLFGILALLVGLVTELGARVIFANKAGPSVLLYGTPWYQPQEQKHPAHTVMFHQNDAGGYRKYFPNEQKRDHDPDTGEEFPVTINSHGFRGEDYSIERTLGTVRIVTLGASSTFGYYDRDDETYPYFLEQRLNQGSRERRYEVINLGMPHLTSWEILALFEAEALQLEPDVVTFYEGANDAAAVDSAVVEETQAKQESALRKRVRERAARLSLLRAVYRAFRDRLILVSLADSLMKSEGVWTYSLADYEKHLAGKSAYHGARSAYPRCLHKRAKALFDRMNRTNRIERNPEHPVIVSKAVWWVPSKRENLCKGHVGTNNNDPVDNTNGAGLARFPGVGRPSRCT